jgi:tRNA(Ile)-lysidine synthase
MIKLLQSIEQRIRTRRLFRRGQSILVAVSGGVDSMVLFHLLNDLSAKHGWRLTIAHLNHTLRGRSSDADENLVRRTARKFGLPMIIESANVRKFARAQGISIEMAARKLRHDFLARTAAQLEIGTVALAHHADDQLELFFLRLLRGSGGDGLAGMKWESPSPSDSDIRLVRPLLDLAKAALLQYAAEQKVPFREDASNACRDILRNRLRGELLPLLRRDYQPGLDRIILRTMSILGSEAEFVTQAALEWLRSARRTEKKGAQPPGDVHFSRSAKGGHQTQNENCGQPPQPAFTQLSAAVQRRCLQLQLLDLGIAADYELVERLRTAAEYPVSASGMKLANAKGNFSLVASAATGLVHLRKEKSVEFKAQSSKVDLRSGSAQMRFDGVEIRCKIQSSRSVGTMKAAAGREYFDADRVGSTVWLRHWRPGDRFQPIGMASAVKLQDFFVNQKVVRTHRHELIVATTEQGELVWVEGQRIGEKFKLTKQTKRRLQWVCRRLTLDELF